MSSPALQDESLHIMAINGSERLGGNTDQVLQLVREHAIRLGVEYTECRLREKTILPCGTCGDCNALTHPCGMTDDVEGIVAAMSDADGLIYAAPVHGFGMAEIMQRFIERAGVGFLRFHRPLANKVGAAIVTGRRYSHDHVHSQFLANMLLNRMIIPGSGYPAVVHGGRPGAALSDQEGLDSVARTVERVIGMIKFIRSASVMGGEFLTVADVNERVVRSGSVGTR
jgi:multimeric flavodoxin WrbA